MTGYAGNGWCAFAGADDRSSAANASEGHVGNIAHVVSTKLVELRIRCKLQKAFAKRFLDTSSVRYVNPSNNMCFRYTGALEELYGCVGRGVHRLVAAVSRRLPRHPFFCYCQSLTNHSARAVSIALRHTLTSIIKKYRIRGPDW